MERRLDYFCASTQSKPQNALKNAIGVKKMCSVMAAKLVCDDYQAYAIHKCGNSLR